MICPALQTSTTLRTLGVFFVCRPCVDDLISRPDRTSSASCPLSSPLTANSSGIRSRTPFEPRSRNLLHGYFAATWGGAGAISRMTNQSFNQQTSGVLSCPCGHSLWREKISLENLPELTNLQSSTFLLQHLKEHLAPCGCPACIGLLLAGLNSDPSVAQVLRPVRFGFQFN